MKEPHLVPLSRQAVDILRELQALTGRGRYLPASVEELRDEIHRFIKVHNAESAKPFKWTKSAAVIIDSVERAKKQINEQD